MLDNLARLDNDPISARNPIIADPTPICTAFDSSLRLVVKLILVAFETHPFVQVPGPTDVRLES